MLLLSKIYIYEKTTYCIIEIKTIESIKRSMVVRNIGEGGMNR